MTTPRRFAGWIGLSIAFVLLPPGVSAGLTPNAQETALADLIRNAAGQQRPSMAYHPILHLAARAKALDFAARNYVSSTDPDGYGPNYALAMAGYDLPSQYDQTLGGNNVESVAAGYTSAQAVFDAWVARPGHREHILGETELAQTHTAYGVGYVYDEDTTHRHYWVFVSAPPDADAVLRPYIEWQFLHQSYAAIDASNLGNGWRELPWFGRFYEPLFRWIYHVRHGWMFWAGTSPSSIWLHTGDLGWLWTSADTYPYLYRTQTGAWLWYAMGTDNPRWFYNLNTASWETH